MGKYLLEYCYGFKEFVENRGFKVIFFSWMSNE